MESDSRIRAQVEEMLKGAQVKLKEERLSSQNLGLIGIKNKNVAMSVSVVRN